MMDKVLEKANTYKWAQLESIQQEYTIFVESESNDRKDAVVEGVDLSSAESLFSNMIYQTDKIQKLSVNEQKNNI